MNISRKGFSLVELMVSTAIVGVLALLAVGISSEVRQNSYRADVVSAATAIDNGTELIRYEMLEALSGSSGHECILDIRPINNNLTVNGGSSSVQAACQSLFDSLIRNNSTTIGTIIIGLSRYNVQEYSQTDYTFTSLISNCKLNAFNSEGAIPTYRKSSREISGNILQLTQGWSWDPLPTFGGFYIIPAADCSGFSAY